MYGDEGRAEDQQQDSDLDDVGRVPGRSKDPRGIPESGAQQVNGRIVAVSLSANVGPVNFDA